MPNKTTPTSMTEEEKREKARLMRNAYLRSWRRRNPAKVRAQIDRYWARKVEKMETEQATDE